jgi:hypothetical protein
MTCTNCGARRDDPTRDFYPLWFTTTTTHAPLCPSCASAQLAERSSNSHTRSGHIIGAEADLSLVQTARASGKYGLGNPTPS